jgi:hypothetical protein
MLDLTRLQPLLVDFRDALARDRALKARHAQRLQRVEVARLLLQPARIRRLGRRQLEPFLQETEAGQSLGWNRPAFWEDLFGADETRLPALRAALKELLARGEAGLSAGDFNALHDRLPPGLGPATLAELLALRFPDRYWLWHRAARKFLAAQGIDVAAELPPGSKRDPGAEYFAAGRHLAALRQVLARALGEPVDFLLVDLFVEWAGARLGRALREPRVEYRVGEHAPAEAPAWAAAFRVFATRPCILARAWRAPRARLAKTPRAARAAGGAGAAAPAA